MNKKILALICLCLAICVIFSGCQLAVNGANKLTINDEFKGFYITMKPLPSKSPDLSDKDLENIMNGKKASITDNSEERFYATAEKVNKDGDETTNFSFKGIDGIPFYGAMVYEKNANQDYSAVVSGPEIFDTVNKVNVGVGFDLTGTIYVDSTLNGAMYCNPVYETSTGEIYMIYADAGAGISGGCTQNMSKTTTTTINGKSTKVTNSIELKIETIDPAKTIILKQFSSDDEFLSATTITQGNIPKYIKKDAKTEYIIAETHGLDSDKKYQIKREFVDLSQDTYDCMFLNNKGFAIPYPVEIK